MTLLTDTHTHLFTEEFDEDRDLAIIRARESGVYRLFMPNIDDTSVESLLSTCKTHPACYPMIGLHPTSVDADWEKRLAAVEAWLRGPETFYGIGEVGIDLYWDRTFRSEQMKAFDIQVQWALEFELPLSIHSRSAYPEVLEVLEPYRKEPALSGIFHCFSGSVEEAAPLLEYENFMLGINGTVTYKKSTLPEVLEVLEPYRKEPALSGIFHCFSGSVEEAAPLLEYENFMLGINGTVTYKKSTLPEVLKHIPLERVVLETDSPYLAPVPHRGKRNESAYLVNVAEKLSDIYGTSLDEIAAQTSGNALKVFSKASRTF